MKKRIKIAQYNLDFEAEIDDIAVPVPDPVPTPIPTPIPTPTPTPTPTPGLIYSPTSFWNKKLTIEPLHSNSVALVAELVAQTKNPPADWPTININSYTRAVYFVTTDIPKRPVSLPNKPGITNDIELKKGIRVPNGVLASNGADGHLCIVDLIDKKEYDFWQFKEVNGNLQASDAGIMYDVLNSDGTLQYRGHGDWNSATASHLPLAGGLAMWSELKAGVIPHGLAIAIFRPSNKAKWPAKTSDGGYTGPNAIDEGQRFRFPSNITINASWCPLIKMMVTAIRDYGLVVVDRSSCVVFCVEDGKQYAPVGTVDKGSWAYSQISNNYMGGKHTWEIISQMPWSQLVALQ